MTIVIILLLMTNNDKRNDYNNEVPDLGGTFLLYIVYTCGISLLFDGCYLIICIDDVIIVDY